MADEDGLVADVARRHGLGEGAVRALWEALVRGGGRQAQFSHPDLGGMGQWSGGGMAQIGDMFNDGLKAKVVAACQDLSAAAAGARDQRSTAGAHQGGHQGSQGREAWWPAELGQPSSTGAQNDSRYAFFPETRRLAIVEGGHVTVYDTGEHRITGTAQQQGGHSSMAFSSPSGPVTLDSLRLVGSREVGQ